MLSSHFLRVVFCFLFFFLVIFGCAGSLLVQGFFSGCSKQRLLYRAVLGLLIAIASCCREWALGYMGFRCCSSWALEHRLNSCGLVVLQHVGSSWTRDRTPVLLHWQVDCLPLSHQRSSSPRVLIVVVFSSTISQNILTIPTEKEGHWKVIRKTGSILNSSSQFTPAFENLSSWGLVASLRRPGFDPRVGKISWRRK